MWLDVRWRAPCGPGRGRADRRGPSAAQQGVSSEPGLPYPWHIGRELRGSEPPTHMAGQVIDRASSCRHQRASSATGVHAGRADARRLGARGAGILRRGTHRGRAVGRRRRRTITLAATATGQPVRCPPDFLDQVAGDLGSKALTHRAGPLLGRARLMTDSSSGVEIGVVEGFMAVRGSGAVIRIIRRPERAGTGALDT